MTTASERTSCRYGIQLMAMSLMMIVVCGQALAQNNGEQAPQPTAARARVVARRIVVANGDCGYASNGGTATWTAVGKETIDSIKLEVERHQPGSDDPHVRNAQQSSYELPLLPLASRDCSLSPSGLVSDRRRP